MDELACLDTTGRAEPVGRREVKPLEPVDAAIARIQRLNPELNAVVTPIYVDDNLFTDRRNPHELYPLSCPPVVPRGLTPGRFFRPRVVFSSRYG